VSPVRYDRALDTATALLRARGADARRDAEILLCAVAGATRASLLAFPERLLDADRWARFSALVARRAEGVPVAYLLEEREFWSLPLRTTPAVLIPRPETEHLVEAALAAAPAGARVLELGTGSGAIAIAIAHERPDLELVAVERSAEALAVARDNAARLTPERIVFVEGDWYAPVRGQRFDLVVSNPPYIAEDEPELGEGDVRFEPREALVAAEGGLAAIARIAAAAPAHLLPGGTLLVEHGWRQGAAVRVLFENAGMAGVKTLRDLAGHERITVGALPAPGDPDEGPRTDNGNR
jgi:release factor glutamine methyltransferase